MFTYTAYLGKTHEDIVDTDKALLVTAAGQYRMENTNVYKTDRPEGRGDYQLYYIASGKAHFYFNGVETVLGKGNMVLFRPNEPQHYAIYSKDDPETYWVHFTGAEVEKLLDYYDMPKGDNVFFSGNSPDYQWLFRQIIQELQLQRANYEDMLNINLRHIFLMINRYQKEGQKIGSEMLDEIERATHYFNENYNKTIVIEKYAEERLMTPAWFIHNFKQVTKLTPMQYILTLRINNAKYLLDSTKYNVTQISNAVGYDNPLYFSRLFCKYVGMSPSEYRKNNISK